MNKEFGICQKRHLFYIEEKHNDPSLSTYTMHMHVRPMVCVCVCVCDGEERGEAAELRDQYLHLHVSYRAAEFAVVT